MARRAELGIVKTFFVIRQVFNYLSPVRVARKWYTVRIGTLPFVKLLSLLDLALCIRVERSKNALDNADV